MPLKVMKTVRVLPDSPGWYWFRTSADAPWEPIQVEWHDAKSQASLLATIKEPNPNDPEVRGKSKLPAPSFILVLRNVEELDGEWGDEIKVPTRSLASSSVETSTFSGSSPKSDGPRQRVHFKPDPNQKMDPAKLEKFFYWIKERHQIWINRMNGLPKPWTKDPILQDWFFCSPYRELDKTTCWFRNKIRQPLTTTSSSTPRPKKVGESPANNPEAVLFATILFRKINYIPSGEALLNAKSSKPTKKAVRADDFGLFTNWDPDLARKTLGSLKQVFTPAHVVATGEGVSKIDNIVQIMDEIWKQREELYERITRCQQMQNVHSILRELPTIGGFVAYEYCCDLRFTHIGAGWTDTLSWANPGPGAMRGLNRLYGRPLSFQRESYEGWVPEMVDLHNLAVNGKLGDMITKPYKEITSKQVAHMNFNDFAPPASQLPFELREIESSLCEFDKYMRMVDPMEGEYAPGANPKQNKRKFNGRK